MASFPKLRPQSRSVQTGCGAVLSSKSLAFLIASLAILPLTAFFAVSELATLRATKASQPGFLTKALGQPRNNTSLVRKPAPGLKVTFGRRTGLTVSGPAHEQITLKTRGAGTAPWQSYANGVTRSTPFGHETVTVDPAETEQFLTVTRHHGVRTWEWNLGTNLVPHTQSDGTIDLVSKRGMPTAQLMPVGILDRAGGNVTPSGLRWKLRKRNHSLLLQLTLDDSTLATPYVIDPTITFDVASSAGNNGSNTITWSHTVANQANRMLIVGYNAENTGTSSCQPTSATYNGVAMTLIAQTVATAVSPNWDCVGMYYLLNPANGAHNVSITFSQTPTNDSISAGAISLYSIAQNPPDAFNTSQAAGLTSTSVTTLWPNSWVVDVMGLGDLSGNLAAAAGQTSRLIKDSTGSNSIGISTKPVATAGSTTMSWTMSPAPNRSAQIVAAFSPLDNTAPSAPALTVTGSAPYSFASGTTLYYNAQGTNSGSFNVSATATDADSGIKKINFPGITGMTGGGDVLASPYQTTYNWTATTTASGNQTVTATNGQNLTSTSTFNVVNDTTAPTGGALSVNGTAATGGGSQSYNSTGSFAIGSRTDWAETQTATASGLASSTLTRQFASFSAANTCGSYGSATTLVGTPAQSGLTTGCYLYTLTGTDNVGNTVSVSTTVKVDTSAPAAPTLAFSNLSANAYYNSGTSTLYLRPSAGGTIRVTATATDNDSGIANYTFLTLNSNGGSNFTETQTGNVMDYTFGATTTVPTTARTVTATNNAGLTSPNASYTILADTTAPTVTAPSVTAGYYTSLSVPVTKNGGTDAGSGVNAATSTLQRDVATLTNGSCGAFSGSWTTVTLTAGNDTTVTSGHCYEYREQLTDNVGNQGNSPASNIAKIDTTPPTNNITLTNNPAGTAYKNGTTIYYNGATTGGGSFTLTNTLTDTDSGPASSTTQTLAGTTTGWTHTPSTVNTPTGGPYTSNTFTWAQNTTSTPTETITGTDNAGNTTTTPTLTFTNDTTAPTGGALTVNGTAATTGGSSSYSTTGNFPIDNRTDYSETQTATAAGLATSTLTRQQATLTNNNCGSYGAPTTIT
ncbi:MAG TPA: hypothetical protein VEH52_06235, partial [Gaiellaceae bacterium]|nr:hypothetical protein [Gaiellaceae bacterium]